MCRKFAQCYHLVDVIKTKKKKFSQTRPFELELQIISFQAIAMEQYAEKRGLASLRYDQSSVGLTTGVTREQVTNKREFN
jgi:hypothetical protein